MKTLKEKLEILDELEKRCDTLEWTYSLDADGNPHEGAVGKEEEKIRAWQIPKTTGQFLSFLINLLQPQHILELGTSVGYSALWMGSAAQTYGGHIDTVEYFEEKVKIAKEYVQKAELEDTITIHKQKIIDFLHTHKGSLSTNAVYDFVFMDADKNNYTKYFEILRQKVSPNCLIVVDNAGNAHHRMKEFIDACTIDPHLITSFLPFDNGLLLVRLGKRKCYTELMQKIATRIFIGASIAFGIIGLCLVIFGQPDDTAAINQFLMKLLMACVFIILPSLALSIAGKYFNN